MPSFTDLLAQLDALDLPRDGFAVFGSGPMAVRGLREVSDLDLILTEGLWEDLAAGHQPVDHGHGLHCIRIGDIEILDGWYPDVGDRHELIAEAELYHGIRFVRLEKVLEWKHLRNDEKDRRDIVLINEWLGHWRGARYVPEKPPSTEPEGDDPEHRVFIGGQYDFMPSLRTIAQMIREFSCEEQPLVPIIAYDYDISPEDTLPQDIDLLRECRFAIFDLSDLGAQLYEMREADEMRAQLNTLIVYPVRERRNQPERGRRTVVSAGFPHFGYQTFDELRGIVWRFLTRIGDLKEPAPRIIHDPVLDSHVRRARLLLKRYDPKGAHRILGEIASDPRYASALEPRLHQAVAAYHMKDEDAVEQAFNRAQKVAHDDELDQGEILYYKGVLARLKSDYELAETLLLKALDTLRQGTGHPDSRVLVTLGYVQRRLRKRPSAIHQMQRALTEDPNIPDPLVTIHALNDLAYYYAEEYDENGQGRHQFLDEAIRLSEDLEDYHKVFVRPTGDWLDTRGWILALLADTARKNGQDLQARSTIAEALRILKAARDCYHSENPPEYLLAHWEFANTVEAGLG
jgi:tetratricopeptide (TPR) repeat protein